MRKLTGEQLGEILDECGIDYSDGYSGRGMYGDECPAIEGSLNECIHALLIVAEYDPEIAKHLTEHGAFDSMGFDTVLYWPSIKYSRESQV